MLINLQSEAGPVGLDVETGEDGEGEGGQRHPTDHFARHVQV